MLVHFQAGFYTTTKSSYQNIETIYFFKYSEREQLVF